MGIDITRNPELGQVWTSPHIANLMVQTTFRNLSTLPPYQILDPAVGPGTFLEAFHREMEHVADKIHFSAYDTDPRMCAYTGSVCSKYGLSIDIQNEDFILSNISVEFDAVIMNPPYIRHEKIPAERKRLYYKKMEDAIGEKIDHRSNLFVLFLLKAILHLRPGGILCAIVYDSIMNSNYGVKTMQLLENFVEVLSNDEAKAPFGDAIIDARIICWRKKTTKTSLPHLSQQCSSSNSKTVPLETLLRTMRGTALPYRKIFVAKQGDRYFKQAVPIVIKQRNPNLLTCDEYDLAYLNATTEIQRWLKDRMEEQGLSVRPALVKPITGVLCLNYYLRDRPRHILNCKGYPISDNYYVSTPLGSFSAKAAWILLNSDLFLGPILARARNQGHGLKKLQAYEYRSALVPNWNLLSFENVKRLESAADNFLGRSTTYEEFRSLASQLAMEVFDV